MDEQSIQAKQYLTVSEVARQFRVSEQNVRKLCRHGTLDAMQDENGFWRISPASATRYKTRHEEKQSAIRARIEESRRLLAERERMREYRESLLDRPSGQTASQQPTPTRALVVVTPRASANSLQTAPNVAPVIDQAKIVDVRPGPNTARSVPKQIQSCLVYMMLVIWLAAFGVGVILFLVLNGKL